MSDKQTTAVGTINYGREIIKYNVFYSNRRTIEIAVHPDLAIVIKAPVDTNSEFIQSTVLKRARWILKQRSYFYQFTPRTPSRTYIGGETHLYLGRQYRLKLNQSDFDDVKLTSGYFMVNCKNIHDSKHIQKQMNSWYRTKAEIKFMESIERCWPVFSRLNLSKPEIQIRSMKTRWGSMSKNGRLTLNSELIRVPRSCIDYVIKHELCHLKYHDHSQEFYELLERVMPDWKKQKQHLELSLI